MLDKSKLEKIIRKKIESDEDIGEKVGGSGHMGSIDYYLNEISKPVEKENNFEITYQYTISITTEFTYYPDNPPREYTNEIVILVDRDCNILEEISSRSLNDNFDPFA